MGSMKEWLHEVKEERAWAWIEENFPDAEEGTEEFEAAAQEYDWMLDSLAEEAERKWFQDSLNDLEDRYRHAVHELNELEELVASTNVQSKRKVSAACYTDSRKDKLELRLI